ncbi:MAG: vWA domain-containing protein [Promethearchaeota archaeon]
MIIFPQSPVWFSLKFIKALRNHEKCLYKPSIRQAIAICKLIISRFLNRGICDTEDFIAIAVITSPLENQELAKKIAKNLLVFTDQSNISSQNMLNASDIFDSSKAKDLVDDIGGNYEELDEIFDDLEFLKKYMNEIEDLDFNLMEESTFNDFYHKFRKELEEDPYKTALDIIDKNVIADFSKFTELKSLLEYAKNIIRKKINNLEPGEINYAKKLGMLDEIIAKSTVKREKLSSQFAKMGELNQNGLEKSLQANLFETLEVVDFALRGKTLSVNGQKIMSEHIKNKLSGPNRNLDDLFSASKIMGSNLNLGKEKMDTIVENSMDLSFKEAYQSAKNYDQYFGGNLSDDYLESINKNIDELSKTNNLEDIRKELTNHPTKVPQWRKLLSTVIDKETQLIKDEYDKNVILSPQMKNFTDKLIASRDNCPDFICKSQLDHKIQDVVNQTTKVAANKDILRSCVKDFNEVGFLPSLDSIRKAGNRLKMTEAEILDLIEANYKYLKKMVQEKTGTYQNYHDYLKQLKLSPQQVEELFKIALGESPPVSANTEAISALNEKYLTQVLNSAEKMGDNALDMAFSSLGAGNGLDLLEQWFFSRYNISAKVKQKLKEIIKHIMIDLGIRSANNLIGSAGSGPIVENIVIPYTEGDDFELIDLEETIDNLLVGGKTVEMISNDDFLVSRTTQGLRCLVLELDISGSMTGRKLSQMALCATMLVYAFKPEELALTFFESNTHKVKDLDDKVELEKVVDELLEITARGGTRINSALVWANHQFAKKARSKHKLNILFTDADVYDYNSSLKELKKLSEKDVKFVMVVPKFNYSPVMAKKMVNEANGVLLTLNQWRDFPKLISDIITNR